MAARDEHAEEHRVLEKPSDTDTTSPETITHANTTVHEAEGEKEPPARTITGWKVSSDSFIHGSVPDGEPTC